MIRRISRIILPHEAWLRLLRRKTQIRLLVCPQTAVFGTGALDWSQFDFDDCRVDPGGTEIWGSGPYFKVFRPHDETRHRLYPRCVVGDVIRLRSDRANGIYVSARVTAIKAQRLNGMTEDDAEQEGARDLAPCEECPCEGPLEDPGPDHLPQCRWSHADIEPDFEPCKAAFAVEWDLAFRTRAPWSSRPWVWAFSLSGITLHGARPAVTP